MADGFKKPNGVALSRDGKVLYVSDTGRETGSGVEMDLPHTIYAFDIVSPPVEGATSKPDRFMWLQNRRVFAVVGASPLRGVCVWRCLRLAVSSAQLAVCQFILYMLVRIPLLRRRVLRAASIQKGTSPRGKSRA